MPEEKEIKSMSDLFETDADLKNFFMEIAYSDVYEICHPIETVTKNQDKIIGAVLTLLQMNEFAKIVKKGELDDYTTHKKVLFSEGIKSITDIPSSIKADWGVIEKVLSHTSFISLPSADVCQKFRALIEGTYGMLPRLEKAVSRTKASVESLYSAGGECPETAEEVMESIEILLDFLPFVAINPEVTNEISNLRKACE